MRFLGVPALVIKSLVRMSQMKILRDAAQGFRMAQEEKAPGSKGLGDTRDDRSGRLKREVHGYVPAKNHVKSIALPEQGILINQVSLFERDHGPHGDVE